MLPHLLVCMNTFYIIIVILLNINQGAAAEHVLHMLKMHILIWSVALCLDYITTNPFNMGQLDSYVMFSLHILY